MVETAIAEADSSTPNPKQSLVDIIQTINAVPDFVVPDKPAAMRRVVEHWEQEQPYFRDVRARGTTLSEEYERIFGGYDGWRTLFVRRMSKQLAPDARAFREVCGEGNLTLLDDTPMGSLFSYAANPLGSGILMTAFLYAIFSLEDTYGASPIKSALYPVASGAIVGATIGTMVPMIDSGILERMRHNAAYLDEKIQEAYR